MSWNILDFIISLLELHCVRILWSYTQISNNKLFSIRIGRALLKINVIFGKKFNILNVIFTFVLVLLLSQGQVSCVDAFHYHFVPIEIRVCVIDQLVMLIKVKISSLIRFFLCVQIMLLFHFIFWGSDLIIWSWTQPIIIPCFLRVLTIWTQVLLCCKFLVIYLNWSVFLIFHCHHLDFAINIIIFTSLNHPILLIFNFFIVCLHFIIFLDLCTTYVYNGNLTKFLLFIFISNYSLFTGIMN